MSGKRGYAEDWVTPLTPRENDGRFLLAGRVYDFWPEGAGSSGLTRTPADSVTVLTTEAGTNIIQIPYRAGGAPIVADANTFTTGFIGDSEDDCRHLERMRSQGSPVLFFPGIAISESFVAPGDGTFHLLREHAFDVVSGVTSSVYPDEIRLDETVNPSAATISGRSVAMSSSGLLCVTYYPAFAVIIETVQWALQDVNQYVGTFTLQEILA